MFNKTNYSKYDEKVAREIQDQLNCTGITENAVIPKEKENYRPRTLVDQTLEYIDPTPNIFTLFVQFNERFFWNVLLPVQVKWSPRMTSCAGICSFHPRSKECVISLSTPLLKLRPRKDLIETLLHEMIHAYLFLTNDNRDRDGHGPIFQSHMKRINQQAGTNITIYHNFHDEVRLYQQHWWRCNGPCQKRAPYFGMVRRAMNRAPGPHDFWYADHQANCGGQFIKVKEPEKPANKKEKTKNGRSSTGTVTKAPEKNSILSYINKNSNGNTNTSINTKGSNTPTQSQVTTWNKNNSVSNVQPGLKKLGNTNTSMNTKGSNTPTQPRVTTWNKNNSVSNVQPGLKKLGNSTNNVFGWGVGGPNSSTASDNIKTKQTNSNESSSGNSRFSFTGTLGGVGTGKSILLDKFANTSNTVSSKNKSSTKNNVNKINSTNNTSKNSSINSFTENLKIKTVNCPNCNKSVEELKINDHLDICLNEYQIDDSSNEPKIIPSTANKKRKNEDDIPTQNKISKNENKSDSDEVDCPLCNKKIETIKFNEHLDSCLQNDFPEEKDDVISLHDSSSSSVNLHDSPHICLICDKALKPNETLNSHLEDCVSSVFNDSNTDDENNDRSKIDEKEVVLDKFPCPVCMELIEESLMNEHLDTCLG